MPDLLIRNVPAALHDRLKAAAAAHRRSLTQEAIQIIENGLGRSSTPRELPPPMIPRRPITMEETLRYIEEGRP